MTGPHNSAYDSHSSLQDSNEEEDLTWTVRDCPKHFMASKNDQYYDTSCYVVKCEAISNVPTCRICYAIRFSPSLVKTGGFRPNRAPIPVKSSDSEFDPLGTS